MDVITPAPRPATFNGPLEAGVRAVAVLGAAHPASFDLQRLVTLDYLLVHTGDIGGPTSLHPPTPMKSAEFLIRRKLVEQALLLMMTRDLVSRDATPDGIRYSAGESAAVFLNALQSDYMKALKERAAWLVDRVGHLPDAEFRALMRRFFDQWVEEFQQVERSLGVEA
ncbi:ABC-three component system middle component 2 [Roseicella sp. DB1501]|uniref:ABC-three component system middle component 2 n=1 Tax=Roseicella sp. DB1501 TaxID=2730925 RepID=UPI001492CA6F|nr:ABC-three component system middle component 2 [Roseicella sp. DB1501]NOG73933.1 threonine transporter [Roseicella sp. DB1501]